MPVKSIKTAAGLATLLAGRLVLGSAVETRRVSTTADMHPSTDVAGLTKAQAESLLDWLESQGRTGCTVTCDDATGYFTVHFPQSAKVVSL